MYSPEINSDQSTEPSHGFLTGSMQAVMLKDLTAQYPAVGFLVSSAHC